MIHMFTKKVGDLLVSGAKGVKKVANNGKKAMFALAVMLCASMGVNAQTLAGTDYNAGLIIS